MHVFVIKGFFFLLYSTKYAQILDDKIRIMRKVLDPTRIF